MTPSLGILAPKLAEAWHDTATAPMVAELLWQAHQADDAKGFLAAGLSSLLAMLRGESLALVTQTSTGWTPTAQSGLARPIPVELVADAMDRAAPANEGGWVVCPLPAHPAPTAALALALPGKSDAQPALQRLERLAPVVQTCLATIRRREQTTDRTRRLEAMLDIANRWNQTREVEPLLVQMAEAATRLLGADRASIFLWDKRNRSLVARPALGVPGGELRIPDDRGVVGQVIHSGRPLRVDSASPREQQQIDRQVDSQLGYQTRSLLCVPLRGGSGELFGAFEVINKLSGQFTAEDESALIELAGHAAIALENAQDRERLLSNSRQISEQAAEKVRLIGGSPAIEALRSMVRRVAETDLVVLILGENGTGKEVVAQMIHYLSPRRHKPFVVVNCAAIPETLAESELFGHEKGAFTDAHEVRAGKFELAAEGTLFLDEIGDLSLAAQAKLLRVLEERMVVRVGGSTTIPTEARVVAATNQDLAEMVRQKRFREDLYFRLNLVTLEIPPLRERPADILLLAEHFLREFSLRARRKAPQFSESAKKRLQSHPWPGNVRELRNLMERLAYLSSADVLEADDLGFILSPRGSPSPVGDLTLPLADATTRFQTEYIRRAISEAGGNISAAAARLGLHRSNLYRKMRQLDMPIPD